MGNANGFHSIRLWYFLLLRKFRRFFVRGACRLLSCYPSVLSPFYNFSFADTADRIVDTFGFNFEDRTKLFKLKTRTLYTPDDVDSYRFVGDAGHYSNSEINLTSLASDNGTIRRDSFIPISRGFRNYNPHPLLVITIYEQWLSSREWLTKRGRPRCETTRRSG